MKTCSVDGCERPHKARGWCLAHWKRWYRNGDVQADKPFETPDQCTVSVCEGEHHAKGLCKAHYNRQRRGVDTSSRVNRSREDRVCSVEGCDRRYRARGFCASHYRRFMEHGSPLPDKPLRSNTPDTCTAEGCSNDYLAKGYCSRHYQHFWKYGRVMAPDDECEICGGQDNLVFDHDHETGQTRGVLCTSCNTGLGKLGDTVASLTTALTYLRNAPKDDSV